MAQERPRGPCAADGRRGDSQRARVSERGPSAAPRPSRCPPPPRRSSSPPSSLVARGPGPAWCGVAADGAEAEHGAVGAPAAAAAAAVAAAAAAAAAGGSGRAAAPGVRGRR